MPKFKPHENKRNIDAIIKINESDTKSFVFDRKFMLVSSFIILIGFINNYPLKY